MTKIERLAQKWRLLLTPPLSGATNMAVDLALMNRARKTGEAVFRIYTWATPTLSLGRNQTAKGKYRLDELDSRNIPVVRRPTGGRAILHWREITYSVSAPASDQTGLRKSYELINNILLEGLKHLGVKVAVAAPQGRAPRPSESPCFATPGEGEMVTEGQKLIGSAQWREDGALLQHGSILVEDDQSLLNSLMTTPADSLPPPATLNKILGHSPTAKEVAEAMFQAVKTLEDSNASQIDAQSVINSAAEFESHFLNNEWTWRR